MAEPLLVAEGIEMTYSDGGRVEALAETSLAVGRGEFVCLLGPSGCGKSTLLHILGGLRRPTAGQVLFDGRPLRSPQQRIAYVFQKANLMPWRTALANVALPLEVRGVPRAEAAARAHEMLALVGLTGFAGSYPRRLSGGMEQRVAIARALVQGAEVLLLDEPFGSLDALTREQLNEELLRIWQAQQLTVVMVTHSIAEAVFLADRVLVLTSRPGRLALELPVTLPRPRPWDAASPTQARLAGELRRAIAQWSAGFEVGA
ncbi:MAG TPA: ABC transporter ATP-binding protein [Anaerolineae bacterium]|nr:ABC transporter ATP-binding protein [Anaerolineae bacterium]HOR00403.1 ABC transporter ATP-binding protein [Anaerolineae bacterium]